MPHGHYMHATRVDYLIAVGLLAFTAIIITLAVNPVRILGLWRDEQRSDDVRKIMSAVLTLSSTHKDKYDALLKRLNGSPGQKFILGSGTSCAGSWGRFCPDASVPDDCLPPEEIFSNVKDAPQDPEHSLFGLFGTGYYLKTDGNQIEAGSCAADTGVIKLETEAP